MAGRAWLVACMVGAGCAAGTEPNCGAGTVWVDGLCIVANGPATSEDGTPPGPGTTPGETAPDTTPPATTPSDPKAPTILSVSSNITSMTDTDLLSITAIVTDPDGIDDLIGGELRGTGNVSYGAFVTSAQEGAYEIGLTWADLHTVEAIDFDETGSRSFTIRFYDVAGHTVETPFELDLYCDLGAACDGVCTDLDADEDHCGQCGYTCPDGLGDACHQGQCAVISDCYQAFDMSCNDLCAASGLGACVTADWGVVIDGVQVDGVGIMHHYNNTCGFNDAILLTCSHVPGGPWQPGTVSMACACLE